MLTLSPKEVRFVGLLILCMMASFLALSQYQAPVASIQAIEVQAQANSLRIVIKSAAPLSQPKIFRLQNPTRLVLDFHGAIPAFSPKKIQVDRTPVVRIRTSLFEGQKGESPVTRVVLDLDRPVVYQTFAEMTSLVMIVRQDLQETGERAMRREVGHPPALTAKTAVSNPVKALPHTLAERAMSNQLNGIKVSSKENSLSIALEFDEPATPQTTFLENPDRMVLDFPNTSYGSAWNQPSLLRVNRNSVKSVRNALYQINPPVMRVVLDRNDKTPPRISSEGRTVILEFGSATDARGMTEAAKRVLPVRAPATPVSTTPSNSQPVSGLTARPPVVTYESGLLTLDADNSTLTDVLIGIAVKTGASIDIPRTDGIRDFVVIKIGPSRPRDVIAALLQGSAYNYYIIEDSAGDMQKVILSPK